jgi:hypothetical protein
MPTPSTDIRAILAQEVARQDLPVSREELLRLLVPPTPITLAWDYGTPGESFQAWVVGRSPDRAITLVYCHEGLGANDPWGFLRGREANMGMDSQWHLGLADAVIAAGLAPAPDGYQVP